jgi:hypothetical protein
VSKYSNDVFFSNEQVGQVGGVQLAEMNLLESYMLEMIDWCLHITEEEFERYKDGLFKHVSEIGQAQMETSNFAQAQLAQQQN